MIKYRKHIDDFFREKLGNYREAPPPEAWGELEQRLDGLTPALPSSYYRFLPHIAIISLLVILGISAGKKLVGNAGNSAPLISSTTGQPTSLRNTATENSTVVQNQTNTPAGNSEPGSAVQQNKDNRQETAGDQQNNSNGNQALPLSAKKSSKKAGNKNRSNHYLASRMMGRTAPFGQEGKTNWTGAKPQAGTVYNAPVNNTQTTEISNSNSAASPDLPLSSKSHQEEILPGTLKEVIKAGKSQDGVKPAERTKSSKIGFRRFEAGVKGGFEQGFTESAAKKYVVSPYLQYNISRKVAIMTQPAVKYANVSSRNLGSKSYYDNYTNESKTYDSVRSIQHIGGLDETYYTTIFKYTESHDSIVKSYKYGGSYFEFEMPLLAKYALSNRLSVYGGVNVVYSKFNGYTESTYINKGITTSNRTSVDVPTPNDQQFANAPAGFWYNIQGNNYAEYKGSPYPTQAKGQINIGYQLGFSYNCSNRWMADALLQQAPVSTTGGNNNPSISTTNLRISIGYKLTK